MWLNKEILPYLCFGCDSCKGTDKELTVWYVRQSAGMFAVYFTMPNKRVLFIGWFETTITKSSKKSIEDVLNEPQYYTTKIHSYQEYLTITNSEFV
jgi:hypothetical protein